MHEVSVDREGQQDHLVVTVCQVLRDLQEWMEYREQMAMLDLLDQKDLRDAVVHKVPREKKEWEARQVPTDPQGLLVCLEKSEMLDLMDDQDTKERGDTMDCPGHEVPLETKDHLGLTDQLVSVDMMEMMDRKVHQVCLETQEILACLERGVHKALEGTLAISDHPVLRVARETGGNEVFLVQRVGEECPVSRENREHSEQRGLKDQEVYPVHLEGPVPRVPKVQRAQLVHPEIPASPVNQE